VAARRGRLDEGPGWRSSPIRIRRWAPPRIGRNNSEET
jgi:hypothetical protein